MEVVRVISSKDKMGFALIVNGFYREKDILCGYWDTKENRRKEKVFRPEDVAYVKEATFKEQRLVNPLTRKRVFAQNVSSLTCVQGKSV